MIFAHRLNQYVVILQIELTVKISGLGKTRLRTVAMSSSKRQKQVLDPSKKTKDRVATLVKQDIEEIGKVVKYVGQRSDARDVSGNLIT